MSASFAPTATDRSDFRTVMLSGTKLGALTAAAVVLFLLVARFVPDTGGARRGLEALLVLAAGGLPRLLPRPPGAARPPPGVARAPPNRPLGANPFMAFDIVRLRP